MYIVPSASLKLQSARKGPWDDYCFSDQGALQMFQPPAFADNRAESLQKELPLNSYCCFEWVVNLRKTTNVFYETIVLEG